MSIVLEPFSEADFDRILSWIPNEETLVLWSGPFFTHPLDTAQLQSYLDSSRLPNPVRRIFRVSLPGGPVIGHIELNNIDYRNLSASISKVLIGDPSYRGMGYGIEMTRQVVRIAFEEMGLHRLQLFVFDFNTPAVRAYQRAGFKIEGLLRDYRKVGDNYWSSYLMALLDSEWQPDASAG